jgi:MoaA/NifB/PqqE/SkfB family radical SAM enzyme
MNYNNIFRVFKKEINDLKYFFPYKKIPENVIWFLTERCSLKCSHCFVSHKGRIFRDELSANQIVKILKGATEIFKKISFTGGEPMLFKDFDTVFIEASRLKKIQQIHLSTNGMHNQKLFDTLMQIEKSDINIQIQSSIDGLKDMHNFIRGNNRSFDNVFDLFDGLKKFKHLNIEKNIIMTCSKDNLKEVEKAIKKFSNIDIPLTINFVRSSEDSVANDKNDFIPLKDVSLSKEEIKSTIDIWKKHFKNKIDKFTYVLNLVRMNNILYFQKYKKWLYKCSAGISDAVILSDGSISVCETKNPIGKLQDFNYSYKDFWKKHYKTNMNECYCNYDCAVNYSVNKSAKGHYVFAKEFLKKLI